MQQVKVSDLRAHLPDFIKRVNRGEQIQITSHGKAVARMIPELDELEAAQKRLDAMRGTMIVGDIIGSIDVQWSGDFDNL